MKTPNDSEGEYFICKHDDVFLSKWTAHHFQPQLNDSKQRESLMYQRVVMLAATKSLLLTDKL